MQDKYKKFREECKKVYGRDVLSEKERELLRMLRSDTTQVEDFFNWAKYNIQQLSSILVTFDTSGTIPVPTGGPDMMSKKAFNLAVGQLLTAFAVSAAAIFSVHSVAKYIFNNSVGAKAVAEITMGLIGLISLPIFRDLINSGYVEAKKYGIVPQYMAYCEFFTMVPSLLGTGYVGGREAKFAAAAYNFTFSTMVTKRDVKEIMEKSSIEEDTFQKFSRTVQKFLPNVLAISWASLGGPMARDNAIGRAWDKLFGGKSPSQVLSEKTSDIAKKFNPHIVS